MKIPLFVICSLLVLLAENCNGYKILGVFPTMAKSHYIVGSALMKGLAEKGHDVTMISPFPLKTPMKNFRDITTNTIVEKMKATMDNLLDMRKQSVIELFTSIFEIGEVFTNTTLEEKSLHELLNSNEKFDIVITEIFVNEAMLGIGNHFKAPVIGLSTFGASLWACEMVGSPSPPSYVPSPFLPMTDRMSLLQRFGNLLTVTVEKLTYEYYHLPKQEALYEKHFPNPKPKLRDLIRNVSLVLLNSHFSLSSPRPYAINMIEVGGMHVNRKVNPLPEDLQKFLDSAKDGAIYFSMGSNIRGKNMAKDKVAALLKVFSSLKQKVLWKWEDKTLPGKPENVLISDWFPQDDILAHPNIKMFITHGGLLSTTEAIYHGVPILAIPIFGDQPLNAARAERSGFGRALAYDQVTEETLREAISDILGNPSFKEIVKSTSARYRDQPQNPLDRAIYWVEYVARHKGAPHMHSAGIDLCFIQYHNLDIFAIIAFVIFLVCYLIRKLARKLCGSKAKKSIDTKKKKN